MPSVMLARNAPGPFRRTLRDKNAYPVAGMQPPLKDENGADRVLTFNPGEPQELSGDDLEAVRDDIGKTLVISKTDDESKPVAKVDTEATAKFVEETRKMRVEEQAAVVQEKREAEAQRQSLLRATGAPTPPAPRRETRAAPVAAPRRGGSENLESKDRP